MQSQSKYKYYFRPGYGSQNLLIEIFRTPDVAQTKKNVLYSLSDTFTALLVILRDEESRVGNLLASPCSASNLRASLFSPPQILRPSE
jgi:hypothetical protein